MERSECGRIGTKDLKPVRRSLRTGRAEARSVVYFRIQGPGGTFRRGAGPDYLAFSSTGAGERVVSLPLMRMSTVAAAWVAVAPAG